MKELEIRMYFFVPYNISEIQKGIQAGHAALEYSHRFGNSELFQKFMNYKTWIILNGGTTNSGFLDDEGSLNKIYTSVIDFNVSAKLKDKIDIEKFYEPDLNDAMTSICFICDERVWDEEKYPDEPDFYQDTDPSEQFESYESWVEYMGGEKNIFLRELIKNKKLA